LCRARNPRRGETRNKLRPSGFRKFQGFQESWSWEVRVARARVSGRGATPVPLLEPVLDSRATGTSRPPPNEYMNAVDAAGVVNSPDVSS
jgi:hypothetical protein